MSEELDRAAALAALTGGEAPADTPTLPAGETIYAGGDTARQLVADVFLTWKSADGLERVKAGPGDTVLVLPEQAKRLDNLGVTVVDADAGTTPADAGAVDTLDLFAEMSADDLVALVKAQPEVAARVREAELARPESRQRSTVLAATEPPAAE